MTVKEYMEKAVEGGFLPPNAVKIIEINSEHGFGWLKYESKEGGQFCYDFESMLLNPLAWQAVGKVSGWEHDECVDCAPIWKQSMHEMIDALAEGKTIEQHLETL